VIRRWLYTVYENLVRISTAREQAQQLTPAKQEAEAVVDKTLGRLVK
jgi:hypothetical protein